MTTTSAPVGSVIQPCPFCGGDELSHGWSSPGVDGSDSTGEVQCHSCDAMIWKPTEAEAIAAWNTRVQIEQSGRVGEGEGEDVEQVGLDIADVIERHLTSKDAIWGLPDLPEEWLTSLRSITAAAVEDAMPRLSALANPPLAAEADYIEGAAQYKVDAEGYTERASAGASAREGFRERLLRDIEANQDAPPPWLLASWSSFATDLRAALSAPSQVGERWRDIASAPKDGTVIDVWREEGGRETVSWGFRPHECGEMGQNCDSDWHSEKEPGWVCSTFGEFVGGKHNPFTHWMPLPVAPVQVGEEGK